jgi:hypothetical protein
MARSWADRFSLYCQSVSLAQLAEAKLAITPIKLVDMLKEFTMENIFIGKRAIVVGAGMGGLSVSRALARLFR